MREIHYLSFGAPNEIEIQRQLKFCKVASEILDAKFNFYLFLFPDDDEWILDDVTIIRLDQMNHFFETLGARINDTLIVNHAFFYPYIEKFIGHEDGALIYHKIDIEYVFMKKIGLDPIDYNRHRKIEIELQSGCDWLYTSSEILIQYMMDNDGYHEHRNSLIPSFSISAESESKNDSSSSFPGKVKFVHIGPVSNRGIKYIKKILSLKANSLVVVADDTKNLMKQGFTKNDRFEIVPFTSNNIQDQLSKSHYCLFRPKPDVSSWMRVEPFIYDCIRNGLKILVPKEYNTGLTELLGDDLIVLESSDFELPIVNEAEKDSIIERYENDIHISSLQNQIKFRNLKNIHDRRVIK
ncbi:MAG: hypothetical protein ACI8XB_000740 [Patiriisocius sp.]|jgi:hypothetical protein